MNIDELPVRCLVHRTLAGTEVAARLVDTPAERYRASFAFIYMVSAESQEHYKQVRGEGARRVGGVLLEGENREPQNAFVGWRGNRWGRYPDIWLERRAGMFSALLF